MEKLRAVLRQILKPVGLLPAARLLRRLILVLIRPEYRRQEIKHRHLERAYRERFRQFKRQHGDVLRHNVKSAGHKQKKILIANTNLPWLEVAGLGLIKALEIAGFVPVVLVRWEQRIFREYYNLVAIKEVHSWSEFCAAPDLTAAEAVIGQFRSVEELLTFEYGGARVGRLAVSTTLRQLRLGSLDLRSAQDRRILINNVASGMASATAAQRILLKVRPELALIVDPVYTPQGEIFDNCLANGIGVIASDLARKINTLMLKRYTLKNRDEHPASLSSESWRLVRDMQWTDAHREQLQREVYSTYASGNWYNVGCNASSSQRLIGTHEIRKRLGLDRTKKTVFIFPHILWDASFAWGDNLFDNYEQWFIKTVHAACANERVNWIIKIHPDHVGKSLAGGFQEEPAEVVALRKHIGELPPHLFLIPADSDICTHSLFELMDYCVTVRGTVGIEAAIRGIPVLTAGTGRYDHKGFTIDSETREEYLGRIAHIQDIRQLSPVQRELAERYAYGLFLLRPLPLTSMTLEYDRDNDPDNYFCKTRFNIKTREEWYRASDFGAFAEWVTTSRQEDFLNLFDETARPKMGYLA